MARDTTRRRPAVTPTPATAVTAAAADAARLRLRLTPHGRLVCEPAEEAPDLDAGVAARLGAAFAQGGGPGLLRLGAAEVGQALPPIFVWWRGFAARYVAALCLPRGRRGHRTHVPDVPPPTDGELASLVLTAPMMRGAEYLTADVLRALWAETRSSAWRSPRRQAGTSLQSLLKAHEPGLEPGRTRALQPGREPPRRRGAVRLPGHLHHPAVRPGAARSTCRSARRCANTPARPTATKLLSLLLPVQRAAETLRLAAGDGRGGRDLPPAALDGPRRRRACSAACPTSRRAGVVVRMPAAWRASRPSAAAGDRDRRHQRSRRRLGLDGLLDFRMDVTLDGETLTEREIRDLLAGTDGLVLLRGQWVEVDRDRLDRTMQQFRAAEELAAARGPALRRGDADAGRRRGRRGRRRRRRADWAQRDGRALAGAKR